MHHTFAQRVRGAPTLEDLVARIVALEAALLEVRRVDVPAPVDEAETCLLCARCFRSRALRANPELEMAPPLLVLMGARKCN